MSQEALANQGEFHAKVPRSEPLTTKGHAPGVKVGNDIAPEFAAETLPAGTAPPDRTFQPNPDSEVSGQGNNPDLSKESWTPAQDTIGGATSKDVHTGLGRPAIGQTSHELHGDRRKEKNGLVGVGANSSDPIKERRLDSDLEKGKKAEDIPGAEERIPESAESLAAEFD